MEQFLFWEDWNSDSFLHKAIAIYWFTAASYIKSSLLNGSKSFNPQTPALFKLWGFFCCCVFCFLSKVHLCLIHSIQFQKTGLVESSASCLTTESSHRAAGGHLQCKYLIKPYTMSCQFPLGQMFLYPVAADNPFLKGVCSQQILSLRHGAATTASSTVSQVGRRSSQPVSKRISYLFLAHFNVVGRWFLPAALSGKRHREQCSIERKTGFTPCCPKLFTCSLNTHTHTDV